MYRPEEKDIRDHKCVHCGLVFKRNVHPNVTVLYCSEGCRYRAKRGYSTEIEDRICVACGASFKPKRHGKKQLYCSSKCRCDRWNEAAIGNTNLPKLTSSTTGAVGELFVACYLLERGISVFRAMSPSCQFDLAALHDGGLVGIEVRTGTRYTSGAIAFNAYTKFADVYAVRLRGEMEVLFQGITQKGIDFISSVGLHVIDATPLTEEEVSAGSA